MSCHKTPTAVEINDTFHDLSGEEIPQSAWHTHQGKGGVPNDEAAASARRMCIALGVDNPDADPRTRDFIKRITSGDVRITLKQKWVMDNAGTIREESALAPRDTLGRVIPPRTNYSGYRISDPASVMRELEERDVKPLYEKLVLEHVTHTFPDKESAPSVDSVRIVGEVHDDGVQALLVEIDGSSDRPSGGLYHVTFTLAEGRKPKESNDVLAAREITYFDQPVDVSTETF